MFTILSKCHAKFNLEYVSSDAAMSISAQQRRKGQMRSGGKFNDQRSRERTRPVEKLSNAKRSQTRFIGAGAQPSR